MFLYNELIVVSLYLHVNISLGTSLIYPNEFAVFNFLSNDFLAPKKSHHLENWHILGKFQKAGIYSVTDHCYGVFGDVKQKEISFYTKSTYLPSAKSFVTDRIREIKKKV